MDQAFMREAVDAAREGVARGDGGPFGAVIVLEGRVVARAWNRVIRDGEPTAHAEVNAIRQACAALGRVHLEGCDLYATCEPCPMCLGAIFWARLRSVRYAATRDDAARIGFGDAAFYDELALPPEQRAVRFVRAESEAALELMRRWQEDPARRLY